MTCEFASRDGAYVLGSLSAAERLEFEQHLGTCQECDRAVRQMAGLPGLLARVDQSVLDDLDGLELAEPLPDSLLPHLHRAVRRSGRRRLVSVGAIAAAVAAVVAVGIPAVLGEEATAPPAATAPIALPMARVGNAPVEADLALEPVTWGTRIDLACTYQPTDERGAATGPPRRMTYTLFVRTKDGRLEQVGTWRSLEGRRMRLTAATATSRTDIASVEVRTTEGKPVLRLTG